MVAMGWYKTPQHEVLSETQAKRELNALGLDRDRLPLIEFGDAAIRELIQSGVTVAPGDIIRITRNSEVAGEGFRYYRKVVV